jgi:hypothetical protein
MARAVEDLGAIAFVKKPVDPETKRRAPTIAFRAVVGMVARSGLLLVGVLSIALPINRSGKPRLRVERTSAIIPGKARSLRYRPPPSRTKSHAPRHGHAASAGPRPAGDHKQQPAGAPVQPLVGLEAKLPLRTTHPQYPDRVSLSTQPHRARVRPMAVRRPRALGLDATCGRWTRCVTPSGRC